MSYPYLLWNLLRIPIYLCNNFTKWNYKCMLAIDTLSARRLYSWWFIQSNYICVIAHRLLSLCSEATIFFCLSTPIEFFYDSTVFVANYVYVYCVRDPKINLNKTEAIFLMIYRFWKAFSFWYYLLIATFFPLDSIVPQLIWTRGRKTERQPYVHLK